MKTSGGSFICEGCATGLVQCDPTDGSFTTMNCQNLSTSTNHCGTCNNPCNSTAGPHCINGQCQCFQTSDCLPTSYCDTGISKSCLQCPNGTATCGSTSFGNVTDCSVDLFTDSNNCGSCNNICDFGQTCVNGKCVCGANAETCLFPNQFCVNGKCSQCNPKLDEKGACSQFAVTLPSNYCSAVNNSCVSCPANFADCNRTNLLGLPDTHLSGLDCETQTNLNGIQQNCGACNANCGFNGHKFQTCCQGQCKCGVFNNTSSPTENECSAAIICGQTEYCDQVLGMCLPLVRNHLACNLNAYSFDEDFSFEDNYHNPVLNLCGSCDPAIAVQNVDPATATCLASNPKQCGASKQVCEPYQVCVNGKCICNLTTQTLSWNPFQDVNPDQFIQNDDYGAPASGCSALSAQLNFGSLSFKQTSVINAAANRQLSYLQNFITCIQLNNSLGITQFTSGNFSNQSFRNNFCTNLPGQCTATYCAALEANFTGTGRSQYCAAFVEMATLVKGCGESFRLNAANGGGLDPSCATSSIVPLFENSIGVNNWFFNYVDLFNFLNCDSSNTNMTYVFQAPFPQSYQYRRATIDKYLANGASMKTSFAIALFVITLEFIVGILG